MNQFYTTLVCSLFFIPCLAQQHSNAQAQQPDLQSLIPVQKGDSFYLRMALPAGKNKAILTNAIRAVGAGLMTYGTAHALSTDNEIGKTTSERRSYLLPAIGAGVVLSANKLTHLGKRNAPVYLQYTLYSKNLTPVGSAVMPINKRPSLLTGQATEDGYLDAQIVTANPKTATTIGEPVISIIPKALDEVSAPTLSRQVLAPDDKEGSLIPPLVDATPRIGSQPFPTSSESESKNTATLPVSHIKAVITPHPTREERPSIQPQVQATTPAPVKSNDATPKGSPTSPLQTPKPVFHKGVLYDGEENESEESEEPDAVAEPDGLPPPVKNPQKPPTTPGGGGGDGSQDVGTSDGSSDGSDGDADGVLQDVDGGDSTAGDDDDESDSDDSDDDDSDDDGFDDLGDYGSTVPVLGVVNIDGDENTTTGTFTLDQLQQAAENSPTIQQLEQAIGLLSDGEGTDFSDFISLSTNGSGSHTNFGTTNIFINQNQSLDAAVEDLAHELNNAANATTVANLMNGAANGTVDESDFATGLGQIEMNGVVTQLVVASELGISTNFAVPSDFQAEFDSYQAGTIDLATLQSWAYTNYASTMQLGATTELANTYYSQIYEGLAGHK